MSGRDDTDTVKLANDPAPENTSRPGLLPAFS